MKDGRYRLDASPLSIPSLPRKGKEQDQHVSIDGDQITIRVTRISWIFLRKSHADLRYRHQFDQYLRKSLKYLPFLCLLLAPVSAVVVRCDC
jgi:hypothetical protein